MNVEKYVKKLKVNAYHYAHCSIKRASKKFISRLSNFNHRYFIAVLVPGEMQVYEPGLFYQCNFKERCSLEKIHTIRIDRNELFQKKIIYFEDDESVYRIKGLDYSQADAFVEALTNLTHIHPTLMYQTANQTTASVSEVQLRAHGIAPSDVLSSISGRTGHLILTREQLYVLRQDGRSKQIYLSALTNLDIRRTPRELELEVVSIGGFDQVMPHQGGARTWNENMLAFHTDLEDELKRFIAEVHRIKLRLPAPKSATVSAQNIPDQIRQLAELRDQGLLTELEFETKKKELLSRM